MLPPLRILKGIVRLVHILTLQKPRPIPLWYSNLATHPRALMDSLLSLMPTSNGPPTRSRQRQRGSNGLEELFKPNLPRGSANCKVKDNGAGEVLSLLMVGSGKRPPGFRSARPSSRSKCSSRSNNTEARSKRSSRSKRSIAPACLAAGRSLRSKRYRRELIQN